MTGALWKKDQSAPVALERGMVPLK